MINNSDSLVISSAQGDYEVAFLKTIDELKNYFSNAQDNYFLVDQIIWNLYNEKLTFVNQEKLYLIDATEESKNLTGVVNTIEWLNKNGASKSSEIIGIGGGVVQDISTFVSHVYYRGINWRYIPTTLLSQSDSCIGAKCGINVLSNKNQVGVLHSPTAVYISEEFLKSLQKYELESGFGEIFKLSVTGPNEFYNELKEHLNNFQLRYQEVLPIIARSLNAKKPVIEFDEYETDLRRILNYGHSFGHSLETLTNNRITHGYAVLIGMDLVNYLGVRWGITEAKFEIEFRALIKQYFPELIVEAIDASNLVNGLKKDKKTLNGKINFAILKSVGDITIVPREIDQVLIGEVKDYLDNVCPFYID
jgi:3-dehydroquinate synthase